MPSRLNSRETRNESYHSPVHNGISHSNDTARSQPSDDRSSHHERSRHGAALADLALHVEEEVGRGGRAQFRLGGEEVFELLVGDGLDELVVAGQPRGGARPGHTAVPGRAAGRRGPRPVEQPQEGGGVGGGVAGAGARALGLLAGAAVARVRHVVPAGQRLAQVHDHRPEDVSGTVPKSLYFKCCNAVCEFAFSIFLFL